MITASVWLLIVIGTGYGRYDTHVVERFPTVKACEHVRDNMRYTMGSNLVGDEKIYPLMRCVQAEVVLSK